jgi:hypothetical protein
MQIVPYFIVLWTMDLVLTWSQVIETCKLEPGLIAQWMSFRNRVPYFGNGANIKIYFEILNATYWSFGCWDVLEVMKNLLLFSSWHPDIWTPHMLTELFEEWAKHYSNLNTLMSKAIIYWQVNMLLDFIGPIFFKELKCIKKYYFGPCGSSKYWNLSSLWIFLFYFF